MGKRSVLDEKGGPSALRSNSSFISNFLLSADSLTPALSEVNIIAMQLGSNGEKKGLIEITAKEETIWERTYTVISEEMDN